MTRWNFSNFNLSSLKKASEFIKFYPLMVDSRNFSMLCMKASWIEHKKKQVDHMNICWDMIFFPIPEMAFLTILDTSAYILSGTSFCDSISQYVIQLSILNSNMISILFHNIFLKTYKRNNTKNDTFSCLSANSSQTDRLHFFISRYVVEQSLIYKNI